jgi:hypothetical protein
LALDDIENDELIDSTSQHNDIIDSEDVIKNKHLLMQGFVDLELPSGTLWNAYNLGVDHNHLDHYQYWNGGYY